MTIAFRLEYLEDSPKHIANARLANRGAAVQDGREITSLTTIKKIARPAGLTREGHPEINHSELPAGRIVPTFPIESSEEVIIKNILKQGLFEKGAQGSIVKIVEDMWNVVVGMDSEQGETLKDCNEPRIKNWEKAMRILRDDDISLGDLLDLAQETGTLDMSMEFNLNDISVYDVLMATVGKLPQLVQETEDHKSNAV